jgi:hypothetical protein
MLQLHSGIQAASEASKTTEKREVIEIQQGVIAVLLRVR